MQRRYGAAAESGRVPSRIREEAEQEGLELRYDLIRQVPNTLLAHRLMELAELKDSQHALAEALFVGYFCNGEDVGDIDTLAGIGAQVGLEPRRDPQAARRRLCPRGGAAAVAPGAGLGCGWCAWLRARRWILVARGAKRGHDAADYNSSKVTFR